MESIFFSLTNYVVNSKQHVIFSRFMRKEGGIHEGLISRSNMYVCLARQIVIEIMSKIFISDKKDI